MTMDDLHALRELGRELESPPPASLVRQRARLAGRAARRRSRRGTWTLLSVVAAATAALVLVPALLPRDRPEPRAGTTAGTAGRPLTILLLGSDARTGAGAGAGTDGPVRTARSDTLLLVHLPADRKSVRAVSLPRDLLVPSVPCTRGVASRGRIMLNAAFSAGGAACAAQAVEKATAVRPDRTMVIDFTGFVTVVNAVGGIRVTLPKSVNDPASGLRLSAGRHLLRGEAALAYVRARHGLGDGSDLARVKRQQQVLAEVVRRLTDAGALTDPVRMGRIVEALASSLAVTPAMGKVEMLGLARSLARTDPADVAFTTVPLRPAAADPARLELKQPQAGRLFAQLK
ncbi:LCP family protein [Actinomadura parmotrematis]|uniref:LCP family protein n=1 Tax=Actinomadura parmotrematis TaxID=2864039 RepID=A0ABS7FWZ3_9ACTN|nr:LCP family protein [Actinomadura parmotrematis]MBW8483968.1 LCP family protein [Actinomadura parmotrematis]